MSSAKRARPNTNVVMRHTKRPIAKELVCISKTAVSTSQVQTDLVTTTFPNTITGLRWSIGFANNATVDSSFRWAIVVIRDGLQADTMGASDAASFYNPESNVLAFGVHHLASSAATGPGPATMNTEGDTKTMRKLQGGDKLAFIVKASAASVDVEGIVQFFQKT